MANQYSLHSFKKAEYSEVVSSILPNKTYSLKPAMWLDTSIDGVFLRSDRLSSSKKPSKPCLLSEEKLNLEKYHLLMAQEGISCREFLISEPSVLYESSLRLDWYEPPAYRPGINHFDLAEKSADD